MPLSSRNARTGRLRPWVRVLAALNVLAGLGTAFLLGVAYERWDADYPCSAVLQPFANYLEARDPTDTWRYLQCPSGETWDRRAGAFVSERDMRRGCEAGGCELWVVVDSRRGRTDACSRFLQPREGPWFKGGGSCVAIDWSLADGRWVKTHAVRTAVQ